MALRHHPDEDPMTPSLHEESDDWTVAFARAFLAGDLSVAGVTRYGLVHAAEAVRVLDAARAAGITDAAGGTDEGRAWQLVSELPAESVAEVHLAAARHLFSAGPAFVPDAVRHARSAGTDMPLDELVAMADHGGRLCLSLGDFPNARELLTLALEFDASEDHRNLIERLIELAHAEVMLGDVEGARDHLARAAMVAELIGEPHLVVRAAVASALPFDWYAGDPRSSALIQRAATMDIGDDDRVALTAARAIVESRVPLLPDRTVQLAWVTRTDVAQALADEALLKSEGARADVRLLALLAWRSTHRSPAHLARRREVSSEALDLAQRLRRVDQQHEAAAWLAVDALESGDRPLFDRCLGVAQWIAHDTRSPRLAWRSHTLAAGAAFLDGDTAVAAERVADAHRAGTEAGHPGRLAADLTFYGQALVDADPTGEVPDLALDDANAPLVNPLFRAGVAHLAAMRGDPVTAERHARIALQQLDPEASYLHLGTRLASLALRLPPGDFAASVISVLTPWADHVSIDAAGWWCDGPVAVWLALLHHHLGDDPTASGLLVRGEATAVAINDSRTLTRIDALRSSITPRARSATTDLTTRELDVLRLMAEGHTNPRIATLLSFSQSTIRMDTISIYRKLEVEGRVEAVAAAIAAGLLAVRTPTSGTDDA